MRNMSFALTTDAVLKQQKTVTRRLGWLFLKPGDLLQPVKKCQGLKPGESIKKIGGPIRVLNVRREPLDKLLDCSRESVRDVIAEGFPHFSEAEFVDMFCKHMRPCRPSWQITRIEFEYVAALDRAPEPK